MNRTSKSLMMMRLDWTSQYLTPGLSSPISPAKKRILLDSSHQAVFLIPAVMILAQDVISTMSLLKDFSPPTNRRSRTLSLMGQGN